MLTLLFVLLKCAGAIAWPWGRVLWPVQLELALLGLVLSGVGLWFAGLRVAEWLVLRTVEESRQ
jgi:hypothetical protein